jgi:hypothetical protein
MTGLGSSMEAQITAKSLARGEPSCATLTLRVQAATTTKPLCKQIYRTLRLEMAQMALQPTL